MEKIQFIWHKIQLLGINIILCIFGALSESITLRALSGGVLWGYLTNPTTGIGVGCVIIVASFIDQLYMMTQIYISKNK